MIFQSRELFVADTVYVDHELFGNCRNFGFGGRQVARDMRRADPQGCPDYSVDQVGCATGSFDADLVDEGCKVWLKIRLQSRDVGRRNVGDPRCFAHVAAPLNAV